MAEMNALGRFLVNNPLWNYCNRRFALPIVLEHVIREDYKTIVDLGCGVGYTTEALASRFPHAEILGIDYDAKQIRKAQKRFSSERVTFAVGDGKQLSFRNNAIDAVFVFDTMHHIEQYEQAAQEISRVLKPGGDFYALDIDKKFFNWRPILWIDRTQSLFSKEEFITTLKEIKSSSPLTI